MIVIPETQSQEKKDMLRLCGAELVEVPALPYSNPNNYQHVGSRLAEQLRKTEPNGVLFADQWNNLDNRKAHYVSTGPEIWEQTGGKVDGFICSVGTGGTLAGVSAFLQREEQGHRDRLSPTRAAPRCTSCSSTARPRLDTGRLDHRRHRARAGHAGHRGRQGRRRLSHPRRGGRADHFRSAGARGPVPRRFDRHQRRRRDPARAASSGRATPS